MVEQKEHRYEFRGRPGFRFCLCNLLPQSSLWGPQRQRPDAKRLTSVCEAFADLNQYSSIKLFFFLWRLYVEASRLGMLGIAGKWRPCKEVDFNLMQVNVIIRSFQNETKKNLLRSRLHHTPIKSVLQGWISHQYLKSSNHVILIHMKFENHCPKPQALLAAISTWSPLFQN